MSVTGLDQFFVCLKRWVYSRQEAFGCGMDYRQVFATNVRRLRREKGFSQEALAHEAEVNRTYMSKVEKGDTWVGLEIMVKLGKVLSVEPADFLQPPPKKPRRRQT